MHRKYLKNQSISHGGNEMRAFQQLLLKLKEDGGLKTEENEESKLSLSAGSKFSVLLLKLTEDGGRKTEENEESKLSLSAGSKFFVF